VWSHHITSRWSTLAPPLSSTRVGGIASLVRDEMNKQCGGGGGGGATRPTPTINWMERRGALDGRTVWRTAYVQGNEWDIHDITDRGLTLPAAAILCTGSCGVLTESSADLDPQQLIERVRSTNPVIGIYSAFTPAVAPLSTD